MPRGARKWIPKKKKKKKNLHAQSESFRRRKYYNWKAPPGSRITTTSRLLDPQTTYTTHVNFRSYFEVRCPAVSLPLCGKRRPSRGALVTVLGRSGLGTFLRVSPELFTNRFPTVFPEKRDEIRCPRGFFNDSANPWNVVVSWT
jgi:hypothetical protein